jgi:TolB-like protein/Tfp pilus assembly protein PilF/predicted Ser/Thr protein kinase
MTPGATLGNYRIERPLGRGGMGEVFLAFDTTLRRPVALKVMDPASGQESPDHLLREARNAAALNHPHICTIHEVGRDGDTAFIAMEFVDGRSLRERIDESGALPEDEALRYAVQAADALACAHDHGVVHRDLKAANAMITTDGRLKIVDFGLARKRDAGVTDSTTHASMMSAGMVAGTPCAMAPEQVRGETADARSDVWALGVLLYEMLTGAKPFEGATVPELFASILEDPLRPWPRHVAAAVRPVVQRCLEKDPAARYQSAREVLLVLQTIEAGLAPAWPVWRHRLARARWWAAAALLLAVALLAGLDVGGLRSRIGGGAPGGPIRLAVLPFANLTGDAAQEYFSDGLTDETISRLGRLHPQRLTVVARTSTMVYKARKASIAEIGRELSVAYVLEGSARREGSRARINVTLVRVGDQAPVWTDGFDREMTSILALQNDVARGVADALALTLLPLEATRLTQSKPIDHEAYEAYLLGSSHVDRLTSADLDVALKYFERAIAVEPSYALAYVGISRVWGARQQLQPAARKAADQPRRAALARALELDSTLPEVHEQLAAQAMSDWDWAAAERHSLRALDLNPNSARVRAFYSQFLNQMKRPAEALAQVERAYALDPLNPSVQTLYGLALNNALRLEEAIAQFQNVLRTSPNSVVALNGLQGALLRLGRKDEALEVQRRRAGAAGDVELEQSLGGSPDQAAALRKSIETLEARAGRGEFVNEVQVALMCLRINDPERAMDWLERAYDSHNPNLPGINNRRPFDPLRGHPRFQALLERMNLPK